MAFLPLESLEAAFDELSEEIPLELLSIMDWFEDNYMGRVNRRGMRRAALFPREIWTVYQRTLDGEPRTNNNVEAAHRRMQAEFGVDHPNLWKFIDGVRKVQSGRDIEYEQSVRGKEPRLKRRKYVKADQRILKIVQEYRLRTNDEYLRGIAHNFLMD